MSKISIIGMGYVGTVSAACLGQKGHQVVGVDLNPTKVDLINEGRSPIIEKDINEMIAEQVQANNLSATTDVIKGVLETEVSIICVGTPSRKNGSLDLTYIERVCQEIGQVIKDKQQRHTVVFRSTMLPGSMREVVIPILEKESGKQAGRDFGVAFNPEFLREGTAVYDFYHPPKTVIGQEDVESGDIVAELYSGLEAPLIRTDIETAEMIKYTDNIWHALKVTFANEVGNICKELEIDGHAVMDIFCHDEKLNLSPYYLKPGFAFGGSCLPKDVRAMVHKGKMLDVDLPVIGSILSSNQVQLERGLDMIVQTDAKNIGVLGFSFKAGTDDLRESPIVEVIERLIGKGYNVKVYDRNVNLAKLMGANRDYILNRIPHIAKIMVDSMDEILDFSETIVIGNNAEEFKGIFDQLKEEQVVVDLVRIIDQKTEKGKYEGICW